MSFRSGEVLHGGAEGFGRKQAHVDLQAAAQVEADLVVAADDDVHERRILRDVGNGLLASCFGGAGLAGDEDVEIADGFAAAAQGSGGRDFVDAGKLLDVGGELLALDLGGVDQIAATDAAIVLDGFDQLGFVLLTHAREFADFSGACQFLDAVYVADLVGAPDQGDGLGAESLDFQKLEHRRVIFLEQFGLYAELAGVEQFLQVRQHAFADAGNGEHLLGISDDVFDLVRVILDGLRRVAIGTDAEGILAVDLEQVGGLVEDVGDGLVIHGEEIRLNQMSGREPA